MERDEVYIPKTRKDLGIPDKPSHQIDWDDIFGDTPIYTLFKLIRQQLLGFPAYLRKCQTNLSGRKSNGLNNSLQRFRSKGLSEVDEPF